MKKQGFSLVELLVSIMVISIIAVAFAPIVTKRIHGSFAGVKKEDQQNDQKKVEAGSVLYTVDTEGCTDKGRYVDCNFIPPEGVKKLNVVVVGSGMGGSGGVSGSTDNSSGTTKSFLQYYQAGDEFIPDPSVKYGNSWFTIQACGGGGGGGGASQYMNGDTSMCATGGGGAYRGCSGLEYYLPQSDTYGFLGHKQYSGFPCFTSIDYLVKVKFAVIGTGGAGGRSKVNEPGEDGADGTDAYMYVTFKCPEDDYNKLTSAQKQKMGIDDDRNYTLVYQLFGGKGGTGGSPGVAGKGGMSKISNYTSDSSYLSTFKYTSDSNEVYSRYSGRIYYYGTNEFYDFVSDNTVLGADGEIARNDRTNPPIPGPGGWRGSGAAVYPFYDSGAPMSINSYGGSCKYKSVGLYNGFPGVDGMAYVSYDYIEDASANFDGAGGAGGGSGGMIHVTDVEVVPGEIYNVWVGKGGKGGAANGELGGSGYESLFGSTSGSTHIIGGIMGGYFSNGATVKAAAQTSSSAAVQGYFRISDGSLNAMTPTYLDNEKSPTHNCSDLSLYTPGYYKFVVSYYNDPVCSLTYYDTSYSSGKALAISEGAQGGDGMKSTTNNEYACGGRNSACGNSNINGQSLTFRAPTVEGVKAGNYGSAGASGGGGGWDKETNTAGKGGDGQDGYVFIYWDAQ